MKLVVGLGNPGPRYAGTRHNVGFEVITRIASKYGLKAKEARNNSLIARGTILGHSVCLQQPLTFMNLSGTAIKQMILQLDLSMQDVLVVVDDLDLPLGKIRMRSSGGSGGHNGLKSIIECVGTNEFPRLRVGISRPENPFMAVEDYVLETWSKREKELLEPALTSSVEAVEVFIDLGVTEAANRFNGS